MKERRKQPADFCAVHDVLLRAALKAPKSYAKVYEFTVHFKARRLKHGVLIEGLKILRDA